LNTTTLGAAAATAKKALASAKWAGQKKKLSAAGRSRLFPLPASIPSLSSAPYNPVIASPNRPLALLTVLVG
jgi:hypothetical protein